MDDIDVTEEVFLNEEDVENIPYEINQIANAGCWSLLPKKSRERYNPTYKFYQKWKKEQGIITRDAENVIIAYLLKLAEKLKPTSLWAYFSRLSNIVKLYNVDISKWERVNFAKTKVQRLRIAQAKVF